MDWNDTELVKMAHKTTLTHLDPKESHEVSWKRDRNGTESVKNGRHTTLNPLGSQKNPTKAQKS